MNIGYVPSNKTDLNQLLIRIYYLLRHLSTHWKVRKEKAVETNRFIGWIKAQRTFFLWELYLSHPHPPPILHIFIFFHFCALVSPFFCNFHLPGYLALATAFFLCLPYRNYLYIIRLIISTKIRKSKKFFNYNYF